MQKVIRRDNWAAMRNCIMKLLKQLKDANSHMNWGKLKK